METIGAKIVFCEERGRVIVGGRGGGSFIAGGTFSLVFSCFDRNINVIIERDQKRGIEIESFIIKEFLHFF